jgi:uncharacterized RDD family membrane protein YckC
MSTTPSLPHESLTEDAATTDPGATEVVPPPWKRIVARVTDEVIVRMVIASIVFALVAGTSAEALAGDDAAGADVGRLVLASLLILGVSFVWEAVSTKLIGGTPMKRVLRLRVVDVTTREPVGWKQSIIRWGVFSIWFVVPVLSVLAPLVLVIVSLVFLFTKPLRRAVWDLAAKTVVVGG